jgi:archaellum component FlaC
MTVDDFSIYGISASILFSIVSLGIALFAVYFTYKQAKISNSQFELELKKVEKPSIIEKIQTKINPLQDELVKEINASDNKELAWIVTNDLYYFPLIFPIPAKKKFHKNFPNNFHTPDLRRDSRLRDLINEIGINIQKRYEIYTKIDDTLRRFTDYIDQSHFDQRISDLLDNTGFKIADPVESFKAMGKISVSVVELNTITKEKAGDILKSLIISTLFKPLEREDPCLIWIGEGGFSTKLYNKISQHLINDPIPQSAEIKQSIENDLVSLKNLDDKILKDIGKLKEIYQEIYRLKESDLNPPQGMI